MTLVRDFSEGERYRISGLLFDALREALRVVRKSPDLILYLNPLDLNDIRDEGPKGLREEPWVGVSTLWDFDFEEHCDVRPGFLRLVRLPGDPRELAIETRFIMTEDRSQHQSEDQDTPSSEAQQPPT